MLVYELVAKDHSFDYCSDKGNGIPTPYEIITKEEYEDLKFRWHNSYHGYNQIHNKEQIETLFPGKGGYASAYMDFNNEYGVAEIILYRGNDMSNRAYVRIGCKHDWQVIEEDRFERVCKCKKCGSIVGFQTGY